MKITRTIHRERAYDRDTSERQVEAFVGVTFPAAERLLAALDAPCNVAPDEDAGVAVGGRKFAARIRSERDVEAAVAEAVRLIEAGAPRVAEEIPDVDALIAPLLADPDDDGAPYKHPAMLAVAGRTDHARQALERYRRQFRTPGFDAYCDTLEAFVRSGAGPAAGRARVPGIASPVQHDDRLRVGRHQAPPPAEAGRAHTPRLLARRVTHRPDRPEPDDDDG